MIVKVVVPDSIYARVYFARGEQGPQGNTGATGATGPTGPAGTNGTNGTNGVGYTGVTSVTNLTIGSGLKTFTLVSSNQGAFVTGMRIRAIHSDTPAYYMEGTANYIGGGTLIITVDKFNGSGSHNSWNFAISGEIGQQGTNGTNGTNGTDGATGPSGVVSVTAPITNSGTSTAANIGIDQTGLTLAQSQITGLVTALSGTAKLALANTFTVGGHIINSEGASVKPLVIRGNSAQTANLQEWQSTASGTVTVASMTDSGLLTTQNLNSSAANIGGGASNGVLSVYTGSASGVGLSVRAASGQTADMQQFTDSTGVVIGRVNSSAQAGYSRVSAGTSTISGVSRLYATAVSATEIPLAVRGAASQSADLFQIQDSAATVLTLVSSAGRLASSTLTTLGNRVQIREQNTGGQIQMSRATAAALNPGSNSATLYFRDGTTGGTLKLVVRAGAAGAETTILDNIPQ